jgi:multiple sugar transport system substrate-binding protein
MPSHTPTLTPTPEWLLPLSELEEVGLVFTHPWTGQLALVMADLVDTFNQTNEFDIFIEINAPGSAQQVFQQSESSLRNAEPANVVIAPIEELAYWYQQDYLVPLDQYLNDPTYGFSEEVIEDFLPLFWQQDIVDENRLGIPIARNTNFLLMNTTWAKELEITMAAMTPAILKNQLCQVRDVLVNDDDWRNNGMGGWIVTQDEYTVLNWLNAYQLEEFPVSETPYPFDQPATLEAYTFLREIFDEDCAWNARNPTHYEYFANRQALYISADVYDLEFVEKTFGFIESEDHWQVVPYPAKDGKPELIIHGDSLGILKSAQAQELASWIFVRWLSLPEQQIKIAQANPGLPVSQSILDQVSTNRSAQWKQVIEYLDTAKAAPRTAEWRVARYVLQDATYQIFLANITPDQYPQIIGLLDTIIAELRDQPATLGWE